MNRSNDLVRHLTLGSLVVALVACGSSAPPNTAGTFTALPSTDVASGDVGSTDTGAALDAGPAEDISTVPEDTAAPVDAGPEDTGPEDTGPVDTGPEDTGPVDVKPCTFDAFIGATGLECGGGLVCVGNQGQCSGKVQGLCKPKIVQCPDITAPVCGCSDTTYTSACEAQKAGVTVKHGGKCGGAPTACGGNTGVVCPADFVCDITSCDPGASGLCVAEPKGDCPPGGIPECGCDSQEYGNTCERLKSKTPLFQKGSCPTSGAIACKIGPAGKILKPCPGGQFCKLNANVSIPCTGDGTCSLIPQVCDKSLNQVCGCDFKTYSNPCEMAKATISLKSAGSCGGGNDGCTEGKSECPNGTYCGVPQGQCGTKGICINKPPPSQCTPDVDVICGCDAKSYSNAGCAAVAGVIVKSKGACK